MDGLFCVVLNLEIIINGGITSTNQIKEAKAVHDKQKGDSSEEPHGEEKKEEAPAEEAENKTDEKS